MTLSRRKTLALIGGGSIVAAAGVVGFAATRPLETALAPWDLAGTYDDPRKWALSYAILAPNPHNRQPWKVDLRTADTVTLYADTDRLLPHTDPFSRQITIGLGCFLEVLRMAAAELGYDAQVALFPEGSDPQALDARPVARVAFVAADTQPDPLFQQVLHRRTLKNPFDTDRHVPQAAVDELAAAAIHGGQVAATIDPDQVAALRTVTRDALLIELETPHTYRESVDLFRIGRREVDATPDGISFTGPLFETLSMFGMMTRAGALDPDSAMFAQGVAAVLANTDSAMGHLWLTTAANDRTSQIKAGQDWVRINLAATALGLGLQPLSQALQEYPEVAAQYAQVHSTLAAPGQTVQMLGRLGYAARPAASPRWPLEAKIIA